MTQPETKIIPHLTCANANEAIEFYKQAFGAENVYVMPDKSGKVMHGAFTIGGAQVYVVDEFPDYNSFGPKHIGGTGVTIHLQVPNVDQVYQRAVDAGCKVNMPLQDMFWGDRYGSVEDPYGHKWSMATTVREVSPEEMKAAMAEF
jgi:uncharacterized glyoxalase superfamily protein PhnB